MRSKHWIERDRGAKEARRQLAVLREKWPMAFPAKPHDVRPLAIGATGEIAAAMGWSVPFTLGVLGLWKMAPVYCQAVLSYDQRVGLDGGPAEPVEAKAKDLATKRLAHLAARKAAKNAVPVVAEPKPVPAPTGTLDELRARVRASLLRRSA